MIAQAADARATLRSGHGALGNVAAKVQLPTEELGGFEVGSKAPLLERLPSMRELELARDNHDRKVARKKDDRR
ncbi:hypothetical protein [Rhizobium sp. Root1220]|uniref:hypothetical protein n=1 Tax=Rhizobium sp. Root1220 TaxID=1736432 RepID=UPI0012E3B2AF|nr:hypothetical protein [Rhizobium sp. Root1220]